MLARPGQLDTWADAILLGHRGESQHTYIIIHHYNVDKLTNEIDIPDD